MNILLVSDVSVSRVIGGAERVLYEQSTRLTKRGHSVSILTRRLADHGSDHEVIQGVSEWRYRVELNNPYAFLRSTHENSRKLFETIHKNNPVACINFHQPFSALGVIGSPGSRTVRKIYTCHSLSFEEYRSRNPKPRTIPGWLSYHLNVWGRRRIEGKVLAKADKIITLSTFTREKLEHAYGIESGDVVVIPGGIDLGRFHPATDRMRIREGLDLPVDSVILFSVRNLVARMGLDRLVWAMKEVVSRIPNVLLVLGGTGPLREELVALSRRLGLEKHILFAGFLPEEDLPDYYRAADLFLLPTVELEGFGLVTLEALASGTPVLGTPVGGTQEILSRLDDKFLFADTSHEAISRLIIETCQTYRDQPGQWDLDSRRCRTFVEQNYSWEANVAATERLFLEGIA